MEVVLYARFSPRCVGNWTREGGGLWHRHPAISLGEGLGDCSRTLVGRLLSHRPLHFESFKGSLIQILRASGGVAIRKRLNPSEDPLTTSLDWSFLFVHVHDLPYGLRTESFVDPGPLTPYGAWLHAARLRAAWDQFLIFFADFRRPEDSTSHYDEVSFGSMAAPVAAQEQLPHVHGRLLEQVGQLGGFPQRLLRDESSQFVRLAFVELKVHGSPLGLQQMLYEPNSSRKGMGFGPIAAKSLRPPRFHGPTALQVDGNGLAVFSFPSELASECISTVRDVIELNLNLVDVSPSDLPLSLSSEGDATILGGSGGRRVRLRSGGRRSGIAVASCVGSGMKKMPPSLLYVWYVVASI
ncbi:hypothetical protein Salat_0761200 [Sesamum alatum]|uniref:Uncharacterized protein n=1 Tax=Sesamum alatum TaxID=300844 RepID=A0AAE1YSM3_9LAMI|nr:hypothetical protein Salat_0761200 [Sesamum alatum]